MEVTLKACATGFLDYARDDDTCGMKFFKNIIDQFAGKPVDWDELEELLIRSDIGVPMTLRS